MTTTLGVSALTIEEFDTMSNKGVLYDNTPVPRENQEYYWTDEWQRGVQASRGDFKKGNYLTFDSPAEAAKWLRNNT